MLYFESIKPIDISQSQIVSAHVAYVVFPVYLANLEAKLKKQPFAILFLYVKPLLNWKICHLNPPPQVVVSHLEAISLNTA
jgi:hypothetical protein